MLRSERCEGARWVNSMQVEGIVANSVERRHESSEATQCFSDVAVSDPNNARGELNEQEF